ncbi:MAG: ABC transporter ATP-binding protein [Chloroflexi bacterium]|nr:ABC transporter ATP-binding protein [Chloroflexota bacterium]
MSQSQISLHSVSKRYRQGGVIVTALDNVNLEIQSGDFLVITGRSGVGKTTLLSVIGGLTLPTQGTIMFNGTNLGTLDDVALSAFRARKMGFVFQFASMLPTLTAQENISVPLLFANGTGKPQRVPELLRLVGLEDRAHHYAAQLSGGQQRRVAIARALINQPAVLLADEPTGDLDTDTEKEILEMLRAFNQQGMTIILVTHNPELSAYGNRTVRMERGKLIEASQ